MKSAIQLIETPGLGALFCVAFLLYCLAEKAGQGTQSRVWGHRVCVTIMLLCLAVAVAGGGLEDTGLIVRMSFRGILLGASISGALTISLLATGWVWERTIGKVAFQRERRKARRAALREREQRQQTELIKVQSQQEVTQQRIRQEERRQLQVEQVRQQQSQRDELKFQVQVKYETHRSEIEHKLPADRMASLISDSFGCDTPIDQCVLRAQSLRDLIESHLPGGSRETVEFTDLESVVQHFSERKRRLRSLDLDDEMIETLEVMLDEAQENAIREFFS